MLGQFDIAARFYDAIVGSAEEVAKEVVEQGKNAVVDEIKQVAQGQSPLATTESLFSFAQNVSNNTIPKLATYFVDNSAALVPYTAPVNAAAQEGTSLLGYAGYGLGALATAGGSVFGLYKMFGAKKKATEVLPVEASSILNEVAGFLTALDTLLKNDAVKAILKALTGEQATQLKALADTTPTYFADLAALPAPVQLLQLTNALKPVASTLSADLKDVNLNDVLAQAKSSLLGTEAASSVSKFGELVDKIMISPEAKQLLAIVGNHDKATQIIGKMNEASLKMVAHNAPKFVNNEKFVKYTDEQHVKLLVGLADKVGQKLEVEVEKKSTLKI